MSPAGSMLPMDDASLKDAIGAVGKWQKTVTDNRYDSKAGEERLRAQQKLARSCLKSAAAAARVIRRQGGDKITLDVLSSLPVLDRPLRHGELDKPGWETDSMVHDALRRGGCTRSHAMEFGWWHLLTIRLLRNRQLSDPPAFLLGRKAPKELPFQPSSLTASHTAISDDQRKAIDTAIRNLLRRGGGIWHRPSRCLIDAPLPAAWWRVEIAKSAFPETASDDLSAEKVYDALLAAWREWADKTTRSSTRLAAPNCVAAYAVTAHRYKEEYGCLPAGKVSRRFIDTLMRRTQHLGVTLVDPYVLAKLSWEAEH